MGVIDCMLYARLMEEKKIILENESDLKKVIITRLDRFGWIVEVCEKDGDIWKLKRQYDFRDADETIGKIKKIFNL